jgi:hypothetical protein
VTDPVVEGARPPERWWICDDQIKNGGTKLLGPFESRELALEVRRYYEACADGRTFWVDEEATGE